MTENQGRLKEIRDGLTIALEEISRQYGMIGDLRTEQQEQVETALEKHQVAEDSKSRILFFNVDNALEKPLDLEETDRFLRRDLASSEEAGELTAEEMKTQRANVNLVIRKKMLAGLMSPEFSETLMKQAAPFWASTVVGAAQKVQQCDRINKELGQTVGFLRAMQSRLSMALERGASDANFTEAQLQSLSESSRIAQLHVRRQMDDNADRLNGRGSSRKDIVRALDMKISGGFIRKISAVDKRRGGMNSPRPTL